MTITRTVAPPLHGDGHGPHLEFCPAGSTDAALIHAWATRSRGRFWGMNDHTVDDVEQVYTWLAESPHHAAWIVRHRGHDLAVFQTYDPAHDPVGEACDVRDGDVGFHLMVGPDRHGVADAPFWICRRAFAALFAAGWQRIIAEPDIRNTAAVSALSQAGFHIGEAVTIGSKTARFAFMTRARHRLRGLTL